MSFDARQVTFALGLRPIENQWVETHTHRYLRLTSCSRTIARQLLNGQAGDVFEVNVRIVSGGLARRSAAERAPSASVHCLFRISSDVTLFSRAGRDAVCGPFRDADDFFAMVGVPMGNTS